MDIFKEFTIEAAHRLPRVPPGHKCGRLRGHSFRIEIHVQGRPATETGWVMDFADVKDAFECVSQTLDHHYMNEIEGLENPTSENLARWIWRKVHPKLPELSSVVVRETCTTGCVYTGEE